MSDIPQRAPGGDVSSNGPPDAGQQSHSAQQGAKSGQRPTPGGSNPSGGGEPRSDQSPKTQLDSTAQQDDLPKGS